MIVNSPRLKCPAVVGKMLDDMTQRLFGGAAAPFIQTLIERNTFTEEEVQHLRSMLDDYQQSKGRST